jgi:hypothetical protein
VAGKKKLAKKTGKKYSHLLFLNVQKDIRPILNFVPRGKL